MIDNPQDHRPPSLEILAPVGSREAFKAALAGGADAVYFGLNTCNARMKADNFSLDHARFMIHTCRQQGIKSYITINTLVKTREIRPLAETLAVLAALAPDALIVQDMGLIRLLSREYPKLALFASTQTSNTNVDKLKLLADMGIQRVILERQLTAGEMADMARQAPLDLEVFVLGAVCYAVSGLCLFSSFIGGRSANRGRCTQPCRRLFTQAKGPAYLFSIKDLDRCDMLRDLPAWGIHHIKIEGRMKPGSYVLQSLTYLRRLLSGAKADKPTLRATCGNLAGTAVYSKPTSGLPFATVATCLGPKELLIHSTTRPKPKDRIRFALQRRDLTSPIYKIRQVRSQADAWRISLNKSLPAWARGSKVYRVSRSIAHLADPFKDYTPSPLPTARAGRFTLPPAGHATGGMRLYYIVDHPGWLHLLAGGDLFYELPTYSLARAKTVIGYGTFGIILPAILWQNEAHRYKKLARFLRTHQVRNIMVCAEGQIPALTGAQGITIYQSPFMKNLNILANQAYRDMGIRRTAFFIEGDLEALTAMPRSVMVALYAHPPLFISRIPPRGFTKGPFFFRDQRSKKRFFVIQHEQTYITIADTAFACLDCLKELRAMGFRDFIIDLRYKKPSRKLLAALDAFKNPGDTSHMNLKRKLQ